MRMACSAWCAERMHSSSRWGLQLGLKLRVVDDVVVREGLLDHHEIEVVELAQMLASASV